MAVCILLALLHAFLLPCCMHSFGLVACHMSDASFGLTTCILFALLHAYAFFSECEDIDGFASIVGYLHGSKLAPTAHHGYVTGNHHSEHPVERHRCQPGLLLHSPGVCKL